MSALPPVSGHRRAVSACPFRATEMALHVLAYNMKRVMRILGVEGLMEAIRT